MRALLLAMIVVTLLWAQDRFTVALSYYYDDNSATNAEAITLLQEVAKEGNKDAAFLVAVAYDKGELIAKDKAKALAWYEKAAKLEDVDAMVLSGWFYYRGEGCKKDLKQAYKWFEKAYKQGDSEAKEMMELIQQQQQNLF